MVDKGGFADVACGQRDEKVVKVQRLVSPAVHSKVRQLLVDEELEYVLVTCRKIPKKRKNAASHMEIELSFEGDHVLMSYLIDGAQNYFESSLEPPEHK